MAGSGGMRATTRVAVAKILVPSMMSARRVPFCVIAVSNGTHGLSLIIAPFKVNRTNPLVGMCSTSATTTVCPDKRTGARSEIVGALTLTSKLIRAVDRTVTGAVPLISSASIT